MDSRKLPIAFVVFLAFVAVVPVWTYFTGEYSNLRPEDSWLASLVLPAAVFLFITSWVKPELSGIVLGAFVIGGLMLLAPWWFRFIDMVSGALVDDPLAQLGLQIAIPLLIVAFVLSIGVRRLRRAMQ